MTDEKNSAATDRDDSEMTDFENFLQNRSLTCFAQIIMNSNHESISTNIIMLITESQYVNNSVMTDRKNSAVTNEDSSETTDFENLSQDRSLTHFSQITSRFKINEY